MTEDEPDMTVNKAKVKETPDGKKAEPLDGKVVEFAVTVDDVSSALLFYWQSIQHTDDDWREAPRNGDTIKICKHCTLPRHMIVDFVCPVKVEEKLPEAFPDLNLDLDLDLNLNLNLDNAAGTPKEGGR